MQGTMGGGENKSMKLMELFRVYVFVGEKKVTAQQDRPDLLLRLDCCLLRVIFQLESIGR
jgi:hypothetical protein